MTPHRFIPRGFGRVVLHLALICGASAGLFAKAKWEPVSTADRESRQCEAFPGVAAEELFKHQVLDSDDRDVWNAYYVRRKVYNAKAAQDAGLLNIPYESWQKLWGLAARVVKADGTIFELDDKDFTETVLAKNKDGKLKAKSVAVPNLESGDIVEYQWSESADSNTYRPKTWFIQSSYPTRLYTFTLKSTKTDCDVLWLNVKNAKASVVKSAKTLTVTDIPPYETEPYSPPELDVRGAIVLINTSHWARWWGKAELWKGLSSEWGEQFRFEIKPGGDIKKAAQEAIGDAATDLEKVARLYNYVRTAVANLNYFDDADLQKARKKLESSEGEQSPAATLKAKSGRRIHINRLFASLCVAAGFEAREVWSTSRDHTTNIKHPQGFVFLTYPLVVIKVGGAWKHYAPGDYFVSPGLLDWQYETAPGLVCEENTKEVTIALPEPAPPAASEELRRGTLAMNAEGDCEGTVKISYTGHRAIAKKHAWADKTRDDIEKEVREDIATRLPTAEISEFLCENTGGIREPATVSYKLKIPSYAEAAGERLIFAPAVFQKGVSPVFKNSTRQWPISFPYAWRVRDEITIALPAGYELDSPSAPKNMGKAGDPFSCGYKISMRKKDLTLVYSRDLVIGDQGTIELPATAYAPIKKIFDTLLASDAHTLVIKPKALAAAPSAPSPTTSANPAPATPAAATADKL